MNDEASRLLIAASYFKQFLEDQVNNKENIDANAYISWLFSKSMEVESKLNNG